MERARRVEVKDYNKFIETRVANRLTAHEKGTGTAREDMFHYLLCAVDPDTKKPAFADKERLLSATRLLTLAGTDTTSLTITALFFYLAHNSRVLKKVATEIRTTFASTKDIGIGTRLSRCQYLRACIEETLRISPPAPGEMPREILPGGAVINGDPYPMGTEVGCSAWSMGRDESVFADVNTFFPERWIPSDPLHLNSASELLAMKKSHHPFSIGQMNCAGQNLAMSELLLASAKTIWATDFQLAPGYSNGEGGPRLGWGQRSSGVYVVGDSWLCLKDGPVLQFRPRSQ